MNEIHVSVFLQYENLNLMASFVRFFFYYSLDVNNKML